MPTVQEFVVQCLYCNADNEITNDAIYHKYFDCVSCNQRNHEKDFPYPPLYECPDCGIQEQEICPLCARKLVQVNPDDFENDDDDDNFW